MITWSSTKEGALLSLGECPMRPPFRLVWLPLVAVGCGGGGSGPTSVEPGPTAPQPPRVETALAFERDTASAFSRSFGNVVTELTDPELQSGGVAAADVDGDGDVDFYVVGGNTEPNHFYRNRGDGTFEEAGGELGLDLVHWGSGPAFGDIDGDGDPDLFVGAVVGDRHHVFENRLDEADGGFVDVTARSGIHLTARNTMSGTFFDYDRDGFVDLFLTHWGNRYEAGEDTETVWRNNGDGSFSNTSVESGIAATLVDRDTDWSFTSNFSDIDGDGDSDLLLASDHTESQVFLNNDNGTFTNVTNRDVIIDQAGMGAAVGDYDNDGDMDWFVTSIYNLDLLDGDYIGNRFYRNEGGGVFSDMTGPAGVADGGWGWGACAADFDNDGNVDILHVNGWVPLEGKDYRDDPLRFFHNTGPGNVAFQEIAREIGFGNAEQGRGVACFDMERDGDVDVLISNNASDNVVLYRNETTNRNHYLSVRLEGAGANRLGLGARIAITTADGSQIRDLGGRNNYVSHDPFEVHFGLAEATTALVEVRWPDGTTSSMDNVAADQQITIRQPATNLRLVVLQGDGGGVYTEGDEITVEARDAPDGYHFSHWSSRGGGRFADPRAARTLFTMPPETVTVTAHYLPGVSPMADVSVARRWNEVLLQAIRNDYARPTVHARNLFHLSAAVYDAWAAFDQTDTGPRPWLLGRSRSGSTCPFAGVDAPDDIGGARRTALSHAAYRLIRHRFHASPGASQIARDADALMGYLGHDVDYVETDIERGPAALGNHIGRCYIDFGFVDGANEANDYANVAYEPVNEALEPDKPGNPNISDLNRWQPLALAEFVDQAGNPSNAQPEFLSPEWGSVVPFALAEEDLTIHRRDGYDYRVYHDPGPPPLIGGADADQYKWSHALVAVWSSHLDPSDPATMDISPASIGNNPWYPDSFQGHPDFYPLAGGDPGLGYAMNPATQAPYQPQVVPRGDYTRALAEFWADGPDSETPPGHWFVIMNEVNDHPLLERRFRGEGARLGLLEWDVKGYFALGGAMHDAAIAAWGAKGWYDSIRPISALRAMADRGQSSDREGPSYHADGIPLLAGQIELVDADDALAGNDGEHVGKIKLLAWRGPTAIDDPAVDVAGVGWILAENWWPYQRPTFVTPPFAGYVSGHSTFSRAAAEVLTALTGDPYFPGGMSDFEVKANEFLVFEDGPSVDMKLQWATYRDASDQCSLSRIWGGIHPPADDIAGRLMGIEIGRDAFKLADRQFAGDVD